MKQLFFYIVAIASAVTSLAQVATPSPKNKMAIFAPLYLDEAFNADGTYRYSSKTFPKKSIAGLEFYHGAAMAVDSLNALNIPLDIHVYDTKSVSESLEQQFSKCAADGVQLILANCTISELTTLSRLAADKKIILINATIPNDAGTTRNPYFVVLNPTLQTQVEGLYHFIKAKYPKQPMVLFTKKGSSENYIRSAFEAMNKKEKTGAVAMKWADVGDSASFAAVHNVWSKNAPAIAVIGSLDADFAAKILEQLGTIAKNSTTVTAIGMPTLENVNLNNSKYKGVEIIYATPFYNPRTHIGSKNIADYYTKKMFARPSDLIFRSFGLTLKFGRLLHKYGKNIYQNLEAKEYSVFFDYDIQPVYGGGQLNYYENKKLYFLKYLNGAVQVL